MRVRVLMALVVAAWLVPMGGCEGYALRGRVVQGHASFVQVVSADDPRLEEGDGIAGASVHVQKDPGRLNRETMARGQSGVDGSFELAIDEFGAGVLEIDIGVFVRRKGFDPAEAYFRLPGSGKRVLVILAPGRDRELGEERETLLDQYEDFR